MGLERLALVQFVFWFSQEVHKNMEGFHPVFTGFIYIFMIALIAVIIASVFQLFGIMGLIGLIGLILFIEFANFFGGGFSNN